MLSRTADHLYWMSRYIERAEAEIERSRRNEHTALPANLADMAMGAVSRHAGVAALRYKRDGRWQDLKWTDYRNDVVACAAALVRRVGIQGHREWVHVL